MDTTQILADLHAELSRITHAIAALESLGEAGNGAVVVTKRRGRPPLNVAEVAPKQATGRRTMSLAARKLISIAAKKRWARVKANAGVKPPKAAKKATPAKKVVSAGKKAAPAHRGISAAARKRMSEAAKARWAARKAAAKTA